MELLSVLNELSRAGHAQFIISTHSPILMSLEQATLYNFDNHSLEPISYQGRTGYAFAYECGDLLQWFSPARMRFRERELMEAVRSAVLALDLEPVIMWSRFQEQLPMLPMGRPTVLVVNLWDKRG